MCSFRFDSFRFDSFVGFDADAGRPLVTRKSESELVRGEGYVLLELFLDYAAHRGEESLGVYRKD